MERIKYVVVAKPKVERIPPQPDGWDTAAEAIAFASQSAKDHPEYDIEVYKVTLTSDPDAVDPEERMKAQQEAVTFVPAGPVIDSSP